MVIIPAYARPPQEEVRHAIKLTLHRVAGQLRCLCWLVEGSGFRAATVRAALAGLALFARAPYPTAVHKDLAEGLDWLFRHFGPEVSAGDIRDAATSIERGRLSARSAGQSAARGC
jgi:hypothetical protein